MDQGAFRASVEEIPVLVRNLANLLSRHLRLTNTHVRTLAALDVPGTVAAQIRGLGSTGGPRPKAVPSSPCR